MGLGYGRPACTAFSAFAGETRRADESAMHMQQHRSAIHTAAIRRSNANCWELPALGTI